MKKIALFLAIFCIYSSTHAGLFEYYLGVDTPSNSFSSAEAVETIEQYVAPAASIYTPTYSNYHQGYNSSYSYYNSCQDWTLGKLRPNCEYYIGYNTPSGNFYEKQHLLNMLGDELDEIEDEQDYVADIISDLKSDIRNAKRYTTNYYKNLRYRLEDELDFFEDKKDDLKDRKYDIEDEIKKVKRTPSSSRSYYYDYYGVYNSYYDSRYGYSSRYNYNYDNYYYDRRYYKYDINSKTYIPHWVNRDLEPVNDGHIYIR